jgi:hypothetical protein
MTIKVHTLVHLLLLRTKKVIIRSMTTLPLLTISFANLFFIPVLDDVLFTQRIFYHNSCTNIYQFLLFSIFYAPSPTIFINFNNNYFL